MNTEYLSKHHAFWVRPAVTPSVLRDVCQRLGEAIKYDIQHGEPIQAIAVRGVSGLVVGGALSVYCNLPLAIVRKPDENSHSDHDVEYAADFKIYAIVDDFVSTGTTIGKIMDSLPGKQLVHIYLYGSNDVRLESWQIPANHPELAAVPVDSINVLRGDMEPTRLWHPNDYGNDAAQVEGSAGRRFPVDEVMLRQMQRPIGNEPSGYCDSCNQRVKATALRPNEQRWNTDQTCTCAACLKYGSPAGRRPVAERKREFSQTWYQSRDRLILCEVCGSQGSEAEVLSLPAWLLKAKKYHVCRECAAVALEV